MTVSLEIAGQVIVRAPGDGDYRATVVPDAVTALAVTLRSDQPEVVRRYVLTRWSGEPWERSAITCTISRHGSAVQPYVAWNTSGPERDPDGLAEYRLQPFLLDRPEPAEGRGLFERGFSWPGLVTPAWIFMAAICSAGDPFCFRTYHAGFSERGYAYCDRDSAAGTWDARDEPPSVRDAFDEWRATGDASAFHRGVAELDRLLQGQTCPCGGSFAFLNPLRCPTDGSVYVDLSAARRRMGEYYYIQLADTPIVKLSLG